MHPRLADRDIWVVKAKVGTPQTGLATEDEVVESVDGDTVTWRVRDFPNTVAWRLP